MVASLGMLLVHSVTPSQVIVQFVHVVVVALEVIQTILWDVDICIFLTAVSNLGPFLIIKTIVC